jgi:hypothetical protein
MGNGGEYGYIGIEGSGEVRVDRRGKWARSDGWTGTNWRRERTAVMMGWRRQEGN